MSPVFSKLLTLAAVLALPLITTATPAHDLASPLQIRENEVCTSKTGQRGTCINIDKGCPGGSFTPKLCPGDVKNECCIKPLPTCRNPAARPYCCKYVMTTITEAIQGLLDQANVNAGDRTTIGQQCKQIIEQGTCSSPDLVTCCTGAEILQGFLVPGCGA
ncbi:hypothetical protein VTL71DRAFT_13020 [Oculimacula yallundae]|uniref:Hydrophobin n=1 Tax=Oculimacula yallundae TaxID=86028 RepID=A0ABR4CPL7_9HELO